MKNINVKKVVAGAAALGVGALMVSGAFAANVTPPDWTSVTKEDLFNNGVPAVNVVVGSLAQPVDVVWAGNIAAAIGSKAYTTVEGSEGGYVFNGVTVEVGSQGTSTISGDGKLFDDTDIGATFTETIDEDDYSLLHDDDVSIDDDETNVIDDEINVKDKLKVTAAVAFDDDEDVGALTATINKGDILYTVEFDDGVPYGYDGSGSPKFKFNFLGKQYQVDELNAAGNTLTLVESQATVTYGVGDSFVPEEGYTIEISDILDNGAQTNPYEAELVLKDAEGNVLDTDVFQTGDEDVFEDYLDASIDIDTVYSTQIKMITGSSGRLELKDGDEIEDFPNTDDELWKIDFDNEGDYITSITMKNNDSDVEWKDEDALRVGDEIELPNDFAKIQFIGLTEENETNFSIEDGIVSYTDDDEEDHELFIYNYDTGSNITEWTTDDKIDDKELYIEIDGTDGVVDAHEYTASLTIQLEDDEGDYLQSDGSWDTPSETWYIDNDSLSTSVDANKTDDQDGWLDLSFATYNNDDETLTYGLFVTESSDKVTDIALGLKKNVGDDAGKYNIYGGDASWKLSGVAYDVSSTYTDDTIYAGSKTDAATIVEGDLESVVEFTVNDGQDVKAYVDPYTGDLTDTEDNDNYAVSNQVVSTNANLGIHDSDDLTEALTNFGSTYKIDSGVFTMAVPEDQLEAQFFIGGGTSTTTTLNGATLTLTTEGEVVSDEDETISAKLVSKDIEATGANGPAMIPAEWNPANLVVLDNQTTANPKVVVGGYMVNLLAQNMGLEEVVTTSGDYVVGKNAEGNIIVAGMEANDTAAAAQELIAAIEAM